MLRASSASSIFVALRALDERVEEAVSVSREAKAESMPLVFFCAVLVPAPLGLEGRAASSALRRASFSAFLRAASACFAAAASLLRCQLLYPIHEHGGSWDG